MQSQTDWQVELESGRLVLKLATSRPRRDTRMRRTVMQNEILAGQKSKFSISPILFLRASNYCKHIGYQY